MTLLYDPLPDLSNNSNAGILPLLELNEDKCISLLQIICFQWCTLVSLCSELKGHLCTFNTCFFTHTSHPVVFNNKKGLNRSQQLAQLTAASKNLLSLFFTITHILWPNKDLRRNFHVFLTILAAGASLSHLHTHTQPDHHSQIRDIITV